MRISDWSSDVCSSDLIGDGGAERLAVAEVVARDLAAEILALGDIFHLGGDDALAGVVHLAAVGAGARAQGAAWRVGELGHAACTVRPELAIVLGADLPSLVACDVDAPPEPGAA